MKFLYQDRRTAIEQSLDYLEERLTALKLKRTNIVRTMLIAEESIIKLLETAPIGSEIAIDVKRRPDQTTVKIVIAGEETDLFTGNDEYADLLGADSELDAGAGEAIRQMLLRSFGRQIRYKYKYHKNTVQILAQKSELAQLYMTLASIALAIIVGMLMKLALPADICTTLNTYLFTSVKTLFLHALSALVGPVVFFSIASCIASFTDLRELGKIGFKVIAFYLMTTCLAVGVGLTLGLSFPVPPSESLIQNATTVSVNSDADLSIYGTLMDIVPSNLLSAFIDGNMLQIIFVALLLGIGAGFTGDYSEKIRGFFDIGNALFLQVVSLVIRLIPLVVFCSITSLVLTTGLQTIVSILGLIVMGICSLIIMVCIYCLLMLLLARMNPIVFIKKAWPAILQAMAICSSNAMMPVTLRTSIEKLGVSRKVASFSIPLGSTINMDGTCSYLAFASLFLYHLYGMPITSSQLVMLVFTVIVLSIGAPGIPGAAFVCLSVLVVQLGIPMESLSIIMAVDPIIAMLRVPANICGDMTGSVIVSKSENLLDKETFYA